MNCKHEKSKVTDSRRNGSIVLRNRKCLNPDCNETFSTMERPTVGVHLYAKSERAALKDARADKEMLCRSFFGRDMNDIEEAIKFFDQCMGMVKKHG